MPTKTDPMVVNVHYGDPNAETGEIGGDFIGERLKGYSFIIDRGVGVDTRKGLAAGREAFESMSVLYHGCLVAQTKRGAGGGGLKVPPATTQHWAALGALERAVVHEAPSAQKGSPTSVRDHFAQKVRPLDRGQER